MKELSKPEEYIGATIEKLVPVEEPHYQLPSGEPVPPPVVIENEYSVPESDTYDIPRSIETPSVENIQIDTEEKVRIFLFPTNQILFLSLDYQG